MEDVNNTPANLFFAEKTKICWKNDFECIALYTQLSKRDGVTNFVCRRAKT